MPTLQERFGKRLKKLREERNFSQAQLAERVGLTPESISNMERGIHAPRFDSIEKLCKALDVRAMEFFKFNTHNIQSPPNE